jgi:hypothetical protein
VVKLTNKIKLSDIETFMDLKDGDYIITSYKNELYGIIFKCPGCVEALGITIKDHKNEPGWSINFETLTATPSILHKRDGRGCGWHGYLTNGDLKSC